MPRKPRAIIPDVPYHITARANRGEFIFTSDKDRELYAEFIIQYTRKLDVKIYAWCIMGNHVHFILEPSTENGLADLFSIVQQRFSRYLNKKRNRYGRSWQERFYSTPLDIPHLYEAVRYVELNPVRAKITSDIFSYRWSSASGRLSGQSRIPVNEISHYLQIDDWVEYLDEISDEKLATDIRSNTYKGLPSGSQLFVGMMEKLTQSSLREKQPGRPGKLGVPFECAHE